MRRTWRSAWRLAMAALVVAGGLLAPAAAVAHEYVSGTYVIDSAANCNVFRSAVKDTGGGASDADRVCTTYVTDWTLEAVGTITVAPGWRLFVILGSDSVNWGVITVRGSLIVMGGMIVNSSGGSLVNEGLVYLDNYLGAVGTVQNIVDGNTVNRGTIVVKGELVNSLGGLFNNGPGATIEVRGGTLTNLYQFPGNGVTFRSTFDNYGTILNTEGGLFDNYDILNNRPGGTITNESDFESLVGPYGVASIANEGSITNACGAYWYREPGTYFTGNAVVQLGTAIAAGAGANGTISPSGSVSVACRGSVTLTITADPHYHVADVVVDGTSVGARATYTFTNVTAPHTIDATFALDTFAIVATAGANGSISPPGTTHVDYLGSQRYAITPATGYHVADVRIDGVSVGAVGSYTFDAVVAAHTIAATFAIDQFPVTAAAGPHGSISPPGITLVDYDGSQAYTMTAATGYHVADVMVDGISVGAVGTHTITHVTGPRTIAVTFAIDTFPIVASAGLHGRISPPGTTAVDYDASLAYTFTPDLGWHVADVQVDGASIGAPAGYTFTHVTGPHTIAVTFAIDTFAITATAGPHGGISPAGTTMVDYDGSQAYTFTPDTGWHVADVRVDGVSVGAPAGYTFRHVTGTHTVAVTFAIDTFAIVATANPNGTITPAGTTMVEYGGGAAFTIAAAKGYHVADVLVDGASVGPVARYAFTNVTAGHTIVASFTVETFVINSSAGPGGSISPAGDVTVSLGGSQAYTITPATGHRVATLVVDGRQVAPATAYTFAYVNAPHTIAATFARETYPITATATRGGTISPSGTVMVEHGGGQAYAIAPAPGYEIGDVTVDGVSVGPATAWAFADVAAAHAIAVTFVQASQQYHRIVATAGPNGWINPNGMVDVFAGSDATFRFAPSRGYHVTDVIVDGVSLGATGDYHYTFTNVRGNHTIAVVFGIGPLPPH